jgi:hypothetical protein
MVRPHMTRKVIHSLLLATLGTLLFHDADSVGVLQGIDAVVDPEVAIAPLFRREALLATRPLVWALYLRVVGEEVFALFMPGLVSLGSISEWRKRVAVYRHLLEFALSSEGSRVLAAVNSADDR